MINFDQLAHDVAKAAVERHRALMHGNRADVAAAGRKFRAALETYEKAGSARAAAVDFPAEESRRAQ
jgi:hypothetical protein